MPSAPEATSAAAATDEDRLPPKEAEKRDALMKPGLADLNRGNNKAAYTALNSVLTTYPNDLYVLRSTGAAAMGAGLNEQAIALFRRALALYPHEPWPLRLAIIILEARLNRWSDFDRDVTALRAAKKNGLDHGLDHNAGFVIDEFDVGDGRVQAVIFPLQSSRYHTLYRFLMPQQTELNAPAQASASANTASARCNNPDFEPYMDMESDDVDQGEFKKAHPDKAAQGERSYSLDSYPSPCSQALIGFYPDGEPTYEKVRGDVIHALTSPKRP